MNGSIKMPLLCLACCISMLSYTQNAALDSIDLFIEAQAKQYHIPGIAACVIKNDSVVWSKAYGYANIANEKPMQNQNILNIASISKTITATAVMQLWEQQRLDLHQDVNDYLDFKVRNPNHPDLPITIHQLLTHTSSIADGPSIKIGYQCGDPKTSLRDWIGNYFKKDGTYYDAEKNFHKKAPDSIRSYSNMGFGLLGLIVEVVAQQPFHEYIKENIFEPLQMHDSGYFLYEVDAAKLVTPYLWLGPLQQNLNANTQKLPYYNPYCQYSFWNYPDGLVRTTTDDLAKFAIAYMNEGLYKGKRILKAETIALMHTPKLSKEINDDQDQGYSWFQSPSLYPTWYHGGSDPGVSTRLYINTKDKLGVIVFQNANADNSFYIVKELYNRFK